MAQIHSYKNRMREYEPTVSDTDLLRVQYFTNLAKSLLQGFDCHNKVQKPEYSSKNGSDQVFMAIAAI